MKKTMTLTILTLASLLFLEINPRAPFYSVSATSVGEPVSENTTWSIEDSPYIVTSDITVDDGATLTIQPGVIVKFDGNFSLIIHGSLYAVGNNTHQIIFTSSKQLPAAGDWNTIEFAGGNYSSFAMNYCVVQFALNGVTIQSERSAVVENSEISNNLYGGINIAGPCDAMIKGNIIKFNGDGVVAMGEVFFGLVATNNSILYSNHGIYIHAYGSRRSIISNLVLSGNDLSHNKYGIYLYSGKQPPFYSDSSSITGFTISDNFFALDEYGIYLETRSWGSVYDWITADNSYIYNGVISNNTLYFNKNGIYIYSGGAWRRFVFDVIVSNNIVASGGVGMYLSAHHFDLPEFDVTLTGNVFSTNEKGVQVDGGGERPVIINMTRNSIAYNTYGVMYNSTMGNVANYNNIYRNTLYGMHVRNSSVNAENNYWGSPTGPSHESNPSGEGDKINGNRKDLVFEPFASEPFGRINEPPVPRLRVDRRKLPVNQTLTLDASASIDDNHVEWYFFDYGDGTRSNWTTASTVTHVYSSPDIYEIQLSVMDNFGVESFETASATVNVTAGPITLVVFLSFNSTSLLKGECLDIVAQATDGDYPVPQAVIELSSDKGGNFSKTSGTSDTSGCFNSTFIPPAVTNQTILTITANATKEGYFSGQALSQVILMPPPIEKAGQPDLTQVLVIALVVFTVVVVAAFLKMRKRV